MRQRTVMRAVKWLSVAGIGLVATGLAQAQGLDSGRLHVTPEFWIGLAFSVLLALVAGYARGIEKRVSMVEYDNRNLQSQISGLREMVKGDYHPKDEVHDQLDDLKRAIESLHRRLDYFSGGKSGASMPGD